MLILLNESLRLKLASPQLSALFFFVLKKFRIASNDMAFMLNFHIALSLPKKHCTHIQFLLNYVSCTKNTFSILFPNCSMRWYFFFFTACLIVSIFFCEHPFEIISISNHYHVCISFFPLKPH